MTVRSRAVVASAEGKVRRARTRVKRIFRVRVTFWRAGVTACLTWCMSQPSASRSSSPTRSTRSRPSSARAIENVAVVVADWPTAAQLGGRPGTLLGLYEGVPLTRRDSIAYAGVLPDRITIFQGPISARAADEPELADLVRTTRAARGRPLLRAQRRAAARARLGLRLRDRRPSTIATMRDGHAWRNWGRTQRCEPAAVETPTSELEVREAIRRARAAGQTVKVVGSRPLLHRHRLHRRPHADARRAGPGRVGGRDGAAGDGGGRDDHPAAQRGARPPWAGPPEPRGHRPSELRGGDRHRHPRDRRHVRRAGDLRPRDADDHRRRRAAALLGRRGARDLPRGSGRAGRRSASSRQ